MAEIRVTARRAGGSPPRYHIRLAGKTIGSAHDSNDGFGWLVRCEEYGIARRNSWAHGDSYETLKDATDAALEYAKVELRKAMADG